MNKVFHFDTPRDAYVADAVVIWCFDSRFDQVVRKFVRRMGIVNVDGIKVAGGAMCLAGQDDPACRDFLVGQLRASIRLHATRRAILTVHSDCGACGGLAAFDGNCRAEADHHAREARCAAANVRAHFPELDVAAYFIDFEGVWEVETPPRTSAVR